MVSLTENVGEADHRGYDAANCGAINRKGPERLLNQCFLITPNEDP
jgi:hypothetical protein